MLHIGEALFYEQVYDQAAQHDLVLLEGVQSKTVRNLTRSYRWLPLKRMGLVLQPKFDLNRAKGRVQGADLTAEEYDMFWRKIPFLKRSGLAIISPLFGLFGRFFLNREIIAKHLELHDLTSREDLLSLEEDMLRATEPIDAKRDERACRILEEAIRPNADKEFSIAVVYGARHMPSILRFLRDLGDYRPVSSEWKTVFEL